MSVRRPPNRSARQRLNAALAEHLINDFTANGAGVIAKLRQDKPADYLRMVTTAFQTAGAPPVAATPAYNFGGRRPAPAPAPAPPPEPTEWRMPPEIEEFLRLTGG
jgi:hypothetical protein